jgi:hypothetical protein
MRESWVEGEMERISRCPAQPNAWFERSHSGLVRSPHRVKPRASDIAAAKVRHPLEECPIRKLKPERHVSKNGIETRVVSVMVAEFRTAAHRYGCFRVVEDVVSRKSRCGYEVQMWEGG